MTQEQYFRAVQINNRLQELRKVKDKINETTKHRLWYAEKGSSEWRLTSQWIMCYISEILDKHDMMIRAEIEEEIKKLEEKIAEI